MGAVETLDVAPGSVVVVRDEEWLVTSVDQTGDGQLLNVQGLSELVRGTNAAFYPSLDKVVPLDPAQTRLVADDSSRYRRSLLWLEATVRKSHLPIANNDLGVSTRALADPLAYQQTAVRTALDPENLRPRILLADAVGLGKTLEIGMILSELIRRGRGDRILIVCPRHVLEQMQLEMWTRFAIPFVRLDSQGVQRVKQKLPATRNPFTYFQRVIISMDTLKQARFERDLRRHRWDAVVIDESHNVTNVSAQNNKLARTLAPNTDALILASATPHNGRKESFSELVRLLEPTAVNPDGNIDTERLKQLVVRRHRNSPEVARVVGAKWAERQPPNNILVPASAAENAVADELDRVWLHPEPGTPSGRRGGGLFGWTLAKAFLSSPAALAQSIAERLRRIEGAGDARSETEALRRLAELNDATINAADGKYAALLGLLREIDAKKTNRAVVFAERVPTLHWLRGRLLGDLKLKAENVAVLHGGLSDDEQQRIVESFKQDSSPIRVLITGDVASEGVNLHRQCHELIHYDIPWSLIRIEQRNGRIDRYGQEHPPRITTLLLDPAVPGFAGDLRVLSKLIDKELEAHTALGDASWLMGKHSVAAEEDEIRRVLMGTRALDDAVPEIADAIADDPIAAMLRQFDDLATSSPADGDGTDVPAHSLYPADVDFLREALVEVFGDPEASPERGGIGWREHQRHGTVEFVPPADLRQRLEVLPQSYLSERKVTTQLMLATSVRRGDQSLHDALSDSTDSTWPEAHYLGPLHPVLDWAADRSLASLGRGEAFVIRGGELDGPTVLLQDILTNQRGQVVVSNAVTATFPTDAPDDFCYFTEFSSVFEAITQLGCAEPQSNPGPVGGVGQLQKYIRLSIASLENRVIQQISDARTEAEERVARWLERSRQWQHEADALVQRHEVKSRSRAVRSEQELVRELAPDRRLVRPLLLVMPGDTPVETGQTSVSNEGVAADGQQ